MNAWVLDKDKPLGDILVKMNPLLPIAGSCWMRSSTSI